jgi:hypothetical protein
LRVVDAPRVHPYIDGMHRPICRRFIALAVAYAVALNLVLPLLPAFALAAEATNPAEICASGGSISPTGLPNGHGSLCPFGVPCSYDCSAAASLALDARSAALFLPSRAHSFSLVRFDNQMLVQRDVAAQFARAPPPV